MSSIFQYFFEPRSVAVIGASKTPGKAGHEILVNLQANGYAGKIFPVNPGGGGDILGLRSYRSVKEISEPIDLGVFIVPAEKTLEPLRECAEKKVPAVVISSGGYAEVDERGARLQEEILAVARTSGMRIIGPNTSGLTSMPASLTTTFFPIGKIRRGPISYIAQTGNFATHTMKWIMTAENFGVSRVAGLGNKMDVEDSEVLDFLGQDPETRAVCMYVEGFRNPRRFWEVARRVTRKKPVVILKGGRTKAGAERAFSHTASLAGDDSVFDGAFKQAGIARVRRYVDLINVAKGIAFQPLPPGRRVASLAPSGALGVVAADSCEGLGLKMVRHSKQSLDKLRKISASWVTVSNPVDMSAITPILGPVEAYHSVVETLLQDEGVDVVVAILLASPKIPAEEYGFLPELSARYPGKAIYVSFTGDKESFDRARDFLEGHSLPVFVPLEDVFETLQVLCRCQEVMNQL
ncbi:MAG TPA: CoA-binding protein [Thermodesulfobacteriota bacterium]|nr:CoA-binding protein [Thermodesulfobacteriota bacterium]